LDTLKLKKKQEEENAAMSIYCPRYMRKHSLRECPLDNISVCGFCTEDHVTEKCPSFPGLLAIYRSGEHGESSYAPRSHGILGTNPHIQIYNLRFHPIINNNNSGTH